MEDLRILFEFLQSLLPAALVAKALTMVPVVTAAVSLLKRHRWVKARVKWAAPALSLLFGLMAGLTIVGFASGQLAIGLGAGVIIGLAAIGGFSGPKNMVEASKGQKVA